MNLGLWIVQGVLGAMFLMAGLMKATRPIAALRERMGWIDDVGPGVTRFIGVSEIAGGLGLVLPWATRTAPILTPIAAAALTLVMVLAAGVHARRREFGGIGVNVVLGGLAAFVAWGRF